jgi:hypothetical protein
MLLIESIASVQLVVVITGSEAIMNAYGATCLFIAL